jgi:flagellar biosynthetic protein FliR
MVALFLSNLCLGIIARTVPQMNILMVGFPINLCIGLIFFALILANVSPYLVSLFKNAGEVFMGMVRLM